MSTFGEHCVKSVRIRSYSGLYGQWCRSGVFIVNFEHISPLFLVFLLLTLNM